MTSDFLKQKLKSKHSYAHFLKKYQEEQKESLVRMLQSVEMELYLYEMLAKESFQAKKIGRYYYDQLCDYYGFENQGLVDHSWQKRLNYYAYCPYKVRNYVVASVLSHQLFHHYLHIMKGSLGTKRNNKKLRDLLKICSDKGKNNTPQDYAKACGLKKNITTRFMLHSIEEILSTTKRHQHTCSHG